MKRIILLLTLVLSLGGNAWAGSIGAQGDGDPLPWPWGTECPFPWDDISGVWRVATDRTTSHTFEFEIINTLNNGNRVFEIRRYNEYGDLVAQGRGLSPAGQRVVRAAVHVVRPHQDVHSASYWVIVRTYVDQEEPHFCTPESRITVVTTRPLAGSCGGDSHYIIKKYPKDSDYLDF